MVVAGAIIGGVIGWVIAEPTHVGASIIVGVIAGTLLAGWVAHCATS